MLLLCIVLWSRALDGRQEARDVEAGLVRLHQVHARQLEHGVARQCLLVVL